MDETPLPATAGLFEFVANAYVLAPPVLFAALAFAAWRYNRGLAAGLAVVGGLFAVQTYVIVVAPQLPVLTPVRMVVLYLLGVAGLVTKLGTDRRVHHQRSTLESLTVLALGALLLAILLVFPILWQVF